MDAPGSGLRGQFGVVFQEDALIPGSVLDNIKFGREITGDDVYAALEIAELLDEVERMPLGLATPVGSRGLHLSGGQCQRLCLARALVHKPSILVLDEASSAIDRLTERRVYDRLLALPCTKVLITHRLYVAESADRVVVLDRGRIVEQGTHHELVGSGGLYARMHGAPRLSTRR
jgi:ABC-type bacteriocin/lantibiotic exporter with double-glycine peptidase domain